MAGHGAVRPSGQRPTAARAPSGRGAPGNPGQQVLDDRSSDARPGRVRYWRGAALLQYGRPRRRSEALLHSTPRPPVVECKVLRKSLGGPSATGWSNPRPAWIVAPPPRGTSSSTTAATGRGRTRCSPLREWAEPTSTYGACEATETGATALDTDPCCAQDCVHGVGAGNHEGF